MGNIDVPTQTNQPLKMPMGTYEFGANLVSSKVHNYTVALAYVALHKYVCEFVEACHAAAGCFDSMES